MKQPTPKKRNNLKLKLHQIKAKSPKRSQDYNKLLIEETVTEPLLSEDKGTVSFTKKAGGQFFQFYRLQKALRRVLEKKFYHVFDRVLPITSPVETIKPTFVIREAYFDSESFYGLDGECTEEVLKGEQYEEFFQILLNSSDMSKIRSIAFRGINYRGKLLYENLSNLGHRDIGGRIRVRKITKSKFQIINISDEEVEIELRDMPEDIITPLMFKQITKTFCQKQTLALYSIKFTLKPFEEGKVNYLRVRD